MSRSNLKSTKTESGTILQLEVILHFFKAPRIPLLAMWQMKRWRKGEVGECEGGGARQAVDEEEVMSPRRHLRSDETRTLSSKTILGGMHLSLHCGSLVA